MLKHKNIEAVIDEMAHQLGCELNGLDKLMIRTRIATALAAKERHYQRMITPDYIWKKPTPRR